MPPRWLGILHQGPKDTQYNDPWPIWVDMVYCNHFLRSDQELHDEAEVLHQLEILLGFEHERHPCPIDPGPGIQERARKGRYQELIDWVHGCMEHEDTWDNNCIMTGHNANDVAETKLFQFLTGRNAVGINKELKSFDGKECTVLRPLLSISRAEIEAYALCFGLPYHEDSSNTKDDYTRNRIRHHLIPWIEQHINPGILKTLSMGR
jgi:tRNA(Ile)-lysidine synthetase-like protein